VEETTEETDVELASKEEETDEPERAVSIDKDSSPSPNPTSPFREDVVSNVSVET
jgi:hypothetical protein